MSNEPNIPQENNIEPLIHETSSVPPVQEPDPITKATTDLFETIKTKAQSEAQKAGEFTRETYLEAVNRVKEQVENLHLFEPKKIETTIQEIQNEVEKDWENLLGQFNDWGDRLNEAAKAAWEALTRPTNEDQDKEQDQD